MKDRSQLTCLIHGPGNLSYDYKVLGDLGYKYTKIMPIKEHRQDPAFNKRFLKQQEKHYTPQNSIDEIILKEKEILIVKDKTHDNLDHEVKEDELYEPDKISQDGNK